VIAEIIDHNRVRSSSHVHDTGDIAANLELTEQAIVDGPTTNVPRQSFPYRHLVLTPFALKKLPRAAGSGVIKKQLEKEELIEKWEKSSWAKKRAAIEARRSLSDFERFGVMLAKKARRDTVRKGIKA
jgi:large subunit ribosomal protein L14e